MCIWVFDFKKEKGTTQKQENQKHRRDQVSHVITLKKEKGRNQDKHLQ